MKIIVLDMRIRIKYICYSNAFDHPLDTRISRSLKGDNDIQTTQRYPSLQERITGIINEDYDILSDDEFLSENYALRHKNNIQEISNALKVNDSFEKRYNPLKYYNSSDSVDYISNKVDDVNYFHDVYNSDNLDSDINDGYSYNYKQTPIPLKRSTHHGYKSDVLKYNDDCVHDLERSGVSFRNKYGSKSRTSLLPFSKFIRESDAKFEKEIMKLLMKQYKIHCKGENKLSKKTKMYLKILSPLLSSATSTLAFIALMSPSGILISFIIYLLTLAYSTTKIRKCKRMALRQKRKIMQKRRYVL
ncbi:Plasmodium exported protein, unknown function [Plasmodium ovale wallikeri]|uniref:Pv-fam-d protein n=1 Tax=Plasmodium ovale wallikeri TaxID=864142 RepID=A0A1A9AJX0_PLAOA|nr:Plasmodium exported protein, unknown function [Plasmodium ovale wallikeri]